MDGVDIWTLVIDGETYEARLDWREELEMIFEEGPDAAAEWFLGVILDIMNVRDEDDYEDNEYGEV